MNLNVTATRVFEMRFRHEPFGIVYQANTEVQTKETGDEWLRLKGWAAVNGVTDGQCKLRATELAKSLGARINSRDYPIGYRLEKLGVKDE